MVNFTQALIAPLYLTAELFFMAGLMNSLREQIYGNEEVNTEEISKTKTKSKS